MLIFDLEMYVPKSHRGKTWNQSSMKANPTRDGDILLGGVFASFPYSDRKSFSPRVEYTRFWLWNYDSERELVEDIHQFFLKEWPRDRKRNVKSGRYKITDLICAGIGISAFDIPALFFKALQYSLDTTERLYDIYFKTRRIELATAAACWFPEKPGLYPSTANQVVQRVLGSTSRKPPGANVWDRYDSGDYTGIEERTKKEVEDMVEIYFALRRAVSAKCLDLGGSR